MCVCVCVFSLADNKDKDVILEKRNIVGHHRPRGLTWRWLPLHCAGRPSVDSESCSLCLLFNWIWRMLPIGPVGDNTLHNRRCDAVLTRFCFSLLIMRLWWEETEKKSSYHKFSPCSRTIIDSKRRIIKVITIRSGLKEGDCSVILQATIFIVIFQHVWFLDQLRNCPGAGSKVAFVPFSPMGVFNETVPVLHGGRCDPCLSFQLHKEKTCLFLVTLSFNGPVKTDEN